jgi:DNA-binding transcriptional ArsR family regulator
MLTLDFAVADLARTRFAISPMSELVAGLRLLHDPGRAGPHLPWLRDALPVARELDLGAAYALTSSNGYMPDFLTPPATSPVATFEEELERVRKTPSDVVRREVGMAFGGRRPPASVAALIAQPRRSLHRMAEVLEAWWRRALEPYWPRVRSLLDADLAHRARRLTEGGPAALFADLHPAVAWREDRLAVRVSFDARVRLAWRGLVIVPSAFYWQGIGPIIDPPWQPTLIYPARGLELLWEPGTAAPAALAAIIGRSRARLLTSLDAPRSTTELARRLELTAGAVSQHLKALRAAGLVTATRHGREVLYLRTEPAQRLLETQRKRERRD